MVNGFGQDLTGLDGFCFWDWGWIWSWTFDELGGWWTDLDRI